MPDKFTQLLPALAALVAFLVAAVLLLYIFRLLFGRRLRSPGGRNRARRLDVVDVYDLDRERQLVIVRRDNIEHLLLIGGPNDILVEATINRLEGAVSRGPEQRPGAPAAANWPAGPSAPPRELEAPLPKPAAAGAVNLPPDLFAPAPTKPAAPPPPPPPPTGPRVSSPAAPPQRPAPPRSPTPPFLARAQQRLAPKPAPAPEAAAPPPPPPPPPAAPPRPAEPPPAPRPAAPPPPAPPPAAARPAAPPPAPPPPPKPAAPPPPPPPPPPAAPADVDPLDSLEAEMARLLGRSDQKE
ncbi:MAG: hypothetical protein CTY30_01190 [Methylocystis sp.]|nr:MAG: hypothetical protein CTY30_01190 [Methylocystis sp.]